MTWGHAQDAIWSSYLPKNEKMLMMIFYHLTNGGLKSFSDCVEMIAKSAGLGIRTCQTTLKSLSNKKLLNIEIFPGRKSQYSINITALTEPPQVLHPRKFCTPAKFTSHCSFPTKDKQK